MSAHGIDELKRQLNNAKSKMDQSRIDFLAAERRLHEVMCRETGLIGKTMRTRKGKEFVVTNVQFVCGKPFRLTGFAIKSDGSVGFATASEFADAVCEVASA